MEVYIDDDKLVIIARPKTIGFNFTKTFDNSLKLEIDSIITQNEFSAEERIKNQIEQLLFKYKHKNDIHENEKQ